MTLEILLNPINLNSQLREELLMNRHEQVLLLPPGTSDGKSLRQRIIESVPFGPLFAILVAFLLWAFSLSGVDLGAMSDLGLISILPPTFYVALLILTVSFCVVVHQRSSSFALLLLHVVALIVMIHSTTPILYGTLRYSWAWKHVGIVDYIMRHGTVDPNISLLGAYHNWPGFFALSALITQIAGFSSPLSYALWATPFFNLLNIGSLLLIFTSFTRDQRLVWLSIWFFYLTNWVGQDYYSPQTLNYFMHLLILGLCLRWFDSKNPLTASSRLDSEAEPFLRTKRIALILVIFAVMTSSHQLTPLMTIGGVAALVLFGRCNVRYLPILMLILNLAWFYYGANAFVSNEIESAIAEIGQVANNVDGNLIDLGQASTGQWLVATIGRALSIFLWALAFFGLIRRYRSGKWDLTAALLLIAPFSMLVGNSYGGEMLFRIYLFTVPFAAFFAAALLYPTLREGNTYKTVLMSSLLSVIMLIGFHFAHFGKEQQYYFTQNEVEAAQFMHTIAPPNSLLIEGERNYPSQFLKYEFYTYLSIARESLETRQEIIADPVKVLTRWMSNEGYSKSYLIITRSQKAGIDMLGDMPRGSLDQIEQTLIASPNFEIIYENEDARIFTLKEEANGAIQP